MPTAVDSNATFDLEVWRVCEGQTKQYAWSLVDDIAELDLLEHILESSKPPPTTPSSKHFLLTTPFRYPERTPGGSRFVMEGAKCALYSAHDPVTCFWEAGHWAKQFSASSTGLSTKSVIRRRCLFSLQVGGPGVDLTAPPYNADAAVWTHPSNYHACQTLGSQVRKAGVPLIQYQSVRDPNAGLCLAVMLVSGITCDKPRTMEDWDLLVSPKGAVWQHPASGKQIPV
ncbi:RES family NAD+ phosphorylase [Chitiniphilus shinanonensis]|uniref:RES family NAD+ phosphorylase n=1 Tax=Chitiniphilus shinanonensis TaxID=553088 RepID=UPI003050E497